MWQFSVQNFWKLQILNKILLRIKFKVVWLSFTVLMVRNHVFLKLNSSVWKLVNIQVLRDRRIGPASYKNDDYYHIDDMSEGRIPQSHVFLRSSGLHGHFLWFRHLFLVQVSLYLYLYYLWDVRFSLGPMTSLALYTSNLTLRP